MLLKKRKLGRKIEDIKAGEKLSLTEKIEDKDLLLYLGLTNDANPLYIQHDYASQTPFEKPIVPSVMLIGIINSAISKYLPGPGSHILSQDVIYHKPVYHYGTIKFIFEVKDVDRDQQLVQIHVIGENEDNELVLEARLKVCPPRFSDAAQG
ncbi:enoyl-CoA hydratase [Peribacillus saganii]|uniref:Enoyl-CoA hydratase n=1 Tax=Peribacillus saganii TaxID=2303992 RepID=A0A372LR80_9BACI|nr:MaoC/PaaZ C-terminal domain-containing protein [Peribacillus saganii]RFU70733.1 enoyl-CoA hydratase [Peribacillus saganii]